ncbi:MAG: heme lyase CcmF/NrfE family subunit, partial [Candidatus Competibacterales bacterium]
SNPFERYLPFFPVDGRDLNPLLQDVGLIVHPPMLYMGYVGFAVAFAFVVAALLAGRLDSAWARWSRPWTTSAWAFLTAGIALGSWWAYYELGWGGFWFWDPVENASFMPWLVGTALIHSLAATEKRGVFRVWTVLLAISAFSLSVLGTFLVRSGVLTSVHAFATDPTRGVFILALLAVITGSALVLLVLRADTIRSSAQFDPVSREMALFANNWLLVGACAVVFLGTLFPLFWDVLGLGKLSVGPPYFDAFFAPLTLGLMAMLGVGPLLRWKRHRPLNPLLWRLAPAALVCGILGLLVPWWVGFTFDLTVTSVVALGLWVAVAAGVDIMDRLRHKANPVLGLLALPWSFVGMILGHVGLAVCVVGVAFTATHGVELDVRLGANSRAEVGPYTFEMIQLQEDVQGPNYITTMATVTISKEERLIATVVPEKRYYTVAQMPMTEVGLRPGFWQDFYVALGEPLPDGSWAVRVQVKPLVRWIWLGALIGALGGLMAILDRRYRKQEAKAPQPRGAEVPAAVGGGALGLQQPVDGRG